MKGILRAMNGVHFNKKKTPSVFWQFFEPHTEGVNVFINECFSNYRL
jgi:hypothetical protein